MSDRLPPKGFNPHRFASKVVRARYEKLAAVAHYQPQASIKLKCLDCCGWEYTEAKRCEINTCPLWALNRWIFARGEGSGEPGP